MTGCELEVAKIVAGLRPLLTWDHALGVILTRNSANCLVRRCFVAGLGEAGPRSAALA